MSPEKKKAKESWKETGFKDPSINGTKITNSREEEIEVYNTNLVNIYKVLVK
jgi:hypothetical protein